MNNITDRELSKQKCMIVWWTETPPWEHIRIEQIPNILNAFEMHQELTGTEGPVYRRKRQRLKWRVPGLVLSEIYIYLNTLYRQNNTFRV